MDTDSADTPLVDKDQVELVIAGWLQVLQTMINLRFLADLVGSAPVWGGACLLVERNSKLGRMFEFVDPAAQTFGLDRLRVPSMQAPASLQMSSCPYSPLVARPAALSILLRSREASFFASMVIRILAVRCGIVRPVGVRHTLSTCRRRHSTAIRMRRVQGLAITSSLGDVPVERFLSAFSIEVNT